MDQKHLWPEANEPVTDLEVRALVERFGERQAMAQGQPTVRDVAEALQVDSETVGKMLHELRESKDQIEVKERLDNLERENAELRATTAGFTGMHTPFAEARIRRPFMLAMVVSLVVVAVATKGTFGQGGHFTFLPLPAALLMFSIVFIAGRRLFGRGRRR